jgi:protein associated with RNAse G/E
MLVSRDGPLLTFLGVFERAVDHPDLGHIEKGTLSHEYYWLDRWYNVFRFENPTGKLRNFYCNVNKPPEFSGNALDYVDLDIDVLIHADLTHEILDQEEFRSNIIRFGYPDDLVAKAVESLEELVRLFAEREFPFESLPKSLS